MVAVNVREKRYDSVYVSQVKTNMFGIVTTIACLSIAEILLYSTVRLGLKKSIEIWLSVAYPNNSAHHILVYS